LVLARRLVVLGFLAVLVHLLRLGLFTDGMMAWSRGSSFPFGLP
jgi:hypothetical protein